MDDPKWLRFITIGLVLAAIAVGYFLLTGSLSSKNTTTPASQISQASPVASSTVSVKPKPTPTLKPISTPTPAPMSAFNTISNRNQGGLSAQALPGTGFPVELTAVFSLSAVIAGWGLRKFPH